MRNKINWIIRWIFGILFIIVYSPKILIEYFSEKIEEDIDDTNSRRYRIETQDVISKKLTQFGLICLSIGLIIGFIIGTLV